MKLDSRVDTENEFKRDVANGRLSLPCSRDRMYDESRQDGTNVSGDRSGASFCN